jgi:hypothetical protein
MRAILLAFSAGMLAFAGSASAVPGGKLGTLDRGAYVCETAGDAATGRGVPVPEAGFEITNSSTYLTTLGSGRYLRTGDLVTMTSGPRKGERFQVQSERFLRQAASNGSETGLRCIRLGSTRS